MADPDRAPGTLTVDDRVFEKVAARAALDVRQVVRHSGGAPAAVGRMVRGGHGVGDDYPWVRLAGSRARPILAVDVALDWPCPVAEVCREVRSHVAAEVERLTGARPVRVDVAVGHLVPRAGTGRDTRARELLDELAGASYAEALG